MEEHLLNHHSLIAGRILKLLILIELKAPLDSLVFAHFCLYRWPLHIRSVSSSQETHARVQVYACSRYTQSVHPQADTTSGYFRGERITKPLIWGVITVFCFWVHYESYFSFLGFPR